MSDRQTWWLSFTDPDRPTGQQWLGAAIVDVTEDEMIAGARIGDAIRVSHSLGLLEDDTHVWMSGAIHKAHVTGCNPGGEVAAVRIDDKTGFAQRDAGLPRDRLLTRAELEALDS